MVFILKTEKKVYYCDFYFWIYKMHLHGGVAPVVDVLNARTKIPQCNLQ